jgi:TrmH family RNA methyltransferase
MLITSATNAKVQRLQKLFQKKKQREIEGVFVAEGVRLVEEAVKWGAKPLELYWSESISERGQLLVNALAPQTDNVVQLAEQLMQKVTETSTSQGVIGIFPITVTMPKDLNFLLIVDQIRDPGNLGTLMRTGKAMGVEGVITTPGTVDAYLPKVIRSAMGVHFALPVVSMSWEEINRNYPRPVMQFWTMVVEGGQSIIQQHPQFPLALVVGGEAEGVSKEALTRSDLNVTIPMLGKTESLNAGVAGSIALYEMMRKRLGP